MSGDEVPIRFDRVTCCYGRTRALDAVSWAVPRGGVTALLGRNGAGKTTAIRALMGLLVPTRGRVEVLGHDALRFPPALRGRIGYVGEGHPLPRWMRARDVVGFQAATVPTFDRALCERWLARFALPLRRRVFQLSRGMRAQLALAVALAPRPELVVMDDPALGLDTVARREFLEVMIDLIQEEGRTLLFTSHVLTDVERVADRVMLLDQGVLRIDAPLDDVRRRVRRYELAYRGATPDDAPALAGLVRARRREGRWAATVVGDEGAVRAAALDLGAEVVSAEALSLEDLFVDYTTMAEVAS
jgi:ABC-2 type transport system ATP-binding protein